MKNLKSFLVFFCLFVGIFFLNGCNIFNSSPNSDSSLMQPVPKAFGIQSVVASGTALVVSWTQSPGATRYSLYRKTGGRESYSSPVAGRVRGVLQLQDFTLISDNAMSPFTDSSVASGTGYTYTVLATGPGGQTASSNGIDPNSGQPINAQTTVIAATPVTLLSVTPATATVTAVPNSATATFSAAITAPATSIFKIGGTCTTAPTASSVSLNSDKTVATGTLTGGSCSTGQTLTLTVDPTTVTNAAGAAGTGSLITQTYTFDVTGPTLSTLTPATSFVNPTPTSLIAVFSKAMTALTSSNFTLGGTCTTLPTKGSVTMSSGNTTATLALSGGTCSDTQTLTVSIDPTTLTDTIGNAGTGSATTRTYTVDTSGPSAALATPSSTHLKSSSSSTIALTYTASPAGGTALTGTLTAGGGGVTVTTLTGNPSCTVGVSAISTSGATLTLSSCSGNGTLTVHVNAATAKDSLNNNSSVSSESSTISVDNTGPTLTSLSPATSVVSSTPTSIVAVFSEAMTALAASNFTLSGTCTTPPTKGAVVMSGGNATATLALTGGTCTNAQALTVSVNPTSATDLAGNAGTGGAVTRTYTVDTTGPTATLGSPSLTQMKSSGSSTIALTYTASAAGGTTLTGTLTAGGGGVTVTTVTGNPSCTVGVSSISTSGATITLSSCSGNGTLTVHVNAATAKDSLNNNSSVSPESSTITIDNTSPTFSSSTPANGSSFSSVPASIAVDFSEAVNSVAGDYSLSSSTCDSNPTVASVSGATTSTITVNLSGGSCTGIQTIVLVVTLTGISDIAGNFGSGTQTITLTNAPANMKKTFVTNLTYDGNLGGSIGADNKCATDTYNPGDRIWYRAMIAEPSVRVACTTANCGGEELRKTWAGY